MHPIHPMVVHFPIALLMASVLFDLAARRWRHGSFREAGFYTLILGVLGAILAVLTGAIEEEAAEEVGIPESVLEIHETLGYTTLALFGALLVVRLAARLGWMRERSALYLTLGLLGVVILSATGFYGGSLVYDFGAGVSATVTESAR
jgi:uncharacterized membrane protein